MKSNNNALDPMEITYPYENIQRISYLANYLTFKLISKYDYQMFLTAEIIIEIYSISTLFFLQISVLRILMFKYACKNQSPYFTVTSQVKLYRK